MPAIKLNNLQNFELMKWLANNRKTAETLPDSVLALNATEALKFQVNASHIGGRRIQLGIIKKVSDTPAAMQTAAIQELCARLRSRHVLQDNDVDAVMAILRPPVQPSLIEAEQA